MFFRGWLVFCVLLGGSGTFAQTAAPTPAQDARSLSYELVAIHKSQPDAKSYSLQDTPEGFDAKGINLRQLLSQAFGFSLGEVLREQIVGLPEWGETQRFDIRAKVDDSNVERLAATRKAETMVVWVNSMVQRKPTPETAMLQQLVIERFHLKMHYEERVMPVYGMTLAKGGTKMKLAHPKDPEHGSLIFNDSKLVADNVPAEFIGLFFARDVGRPIVNRTDLPGGYDFEMPSNWQKAATTASDAGPDVSAGDTGPSIFTALDEQLGLKLVPAKEPVPVIVVDHVEMPDDN